MPVPRLPVASSAVVWRLATGNRATPLHFGPRCSSPAISARTATCSFSSQNTAAKTSACRSIPEDILAAEDEPRRDRAGRPAARRGVRRRAQGDGADVREVRAGPLDASRHRAAGVHRRAGVAAGRRRAVLVRRGRADRRGGAEASASRRPSSPSKPRRSPPRPSARCIAPCCATAARSWSRCSVRTCASRCGTTSKSSPRSPPRSNSTATSAAR